jgi:hypothetical protein
VSVLAIRGRLGGICQYLCDAEAASIYSGKRVGIATIALCR